MAPVRLSAPRWLALGVLGSALAGAPGSWQVVDARGQLALARQVRPNRPCPALNLPASWRVLDEVYADVTGDGVPECLLAVWRPWKDWPTRRWSAQPSPIAGNHDAAGFSAHLAVLTPLGQGKYRERWVGSALYQPVVAITALPGGRLAALETTYALGSAAPGQHLSVWSWTGFGFRREERWALRARHLALDLVTRRPAAR
ncbi:hypothetical protein DKM44_05150 [Deinococcus irradiatisoli]|uniref:Uncharacterized protein n=1 Tax=Deinococcus irradiatisoli TaxID=2202254 RepID=A0A2Z3JFB9_9DEIO|nr:hypothetical protein [Deinococcus irradiatisoli]AWN22696.1 hypothetical protein DKM44_05150 [Deinococcus irradiatisoli]